jgi:hypothetical protein
MAAEKLIGLIERQKSMIIEHIIIPGELEKGASVGI